MADLIKCPFCGEDDFDQVGLKSHLLGGARWFGEASGCDGWIAADTDEGWAEHAAALRVASDMSRQQARSAADSHEQVAAKDNGPTQNPVEIQAPGHPL